MKLYLFIVSSVVIIVLAENVIHDTYELYNSLPENEKVDFLVYALAKAMTQNNTYSKQLEEVLLTRSKMNKTSLLKFQKYPLDRQFLSDYLNFLQNKLQIPSSGMIEIVLNVKFCPLKPEDCIAEVDIADFCCPFGYKNSTRRFD